MAWSTIVTASPTWFVKSETNWLKIGWAWFQTCWPANNNWLPTARNWLTTELPKSWIVDQTEPKLKAFKMKSRIEFLLPLNNDERTELTIDCNCGDNVLTNWSTNGVTKLIKPVKSLLPPIAPPNVPMMFNNKLCNWPPKADNSSKILVWVSALRTRALLALPPKTWATSETRTSLILSTKFWINWLAFKSDNTDCKSNLLCGNTPKRLVINWLRAVWTVCCKVSNRPLNGPDSAYVPATHTNKTNKKAFIFILF